MFWRQVVADAQVSGLQQGQVSQTDARRAQQFSSRPTNFSGFERDRFWFRDQGQFVPAAYSSGLDFDTDGRASATLDFDGDGDLDIVTLSRQKLRLLENRSQSSHHYVRFSLVEENGQAALGAQIEVTTDKVGTQIDYVKASSGFATAVLPMLHFGLRNDKRVRKIRVRWSDGSEHVFKNLMADQHWRIEKGKEPELLKSPRWASRLEDRFEVSRYAIPNQLPDLDGKFKTIPASDGPRVVSFWASWCEACEKEHPELVRFAQTKRAQVIGVSVDEKPEDARKFALGHPTPFPNYLASDELVKNFFGESAEIQLPASFVFDAEGKLSRAFFYPVSENGLRQAVQSTSRVGLQKGDAYSMRQQAEKFLVVGKHKQALELHQKALKLAPDSATDQMTTGFILKAEGRLLEARRHFEQAMKIDRNYAAPYVALADLELRRGKFVKAKRLYEQAMELKPDFAPAVRGHARALKQIRLQNR